MKNMLKLLAILLLLGSSSAGLFKKKNKVTNKKKSFFKKTTGTIDSKDGNYIGVKVATKAKNELTYSQAQSYCERVYGTSLATILDATDQSEIYDLLYDDDWGNAVNQVWVGFKGDAYYLISGAFGSSTPNYYYSYEPCSDCKDYWECSAKDAYDENGGEGLAPFNVDSDLCGVIRRANKATIGQWGLAYCTKKREFICNSPTGKYATLPFECGAPSDDDTDTEPTEATEETEEVCDSTVNDGAVNVAFLVDEVYGISESQLNVIGAFIERIVTYDLNDISYVGLYEFSSDDWQTYRQALDFSVTSDKDAVISWLESNDVDVNEEGTEMGNVMVDIMDKVMLNIHGASEVDPCPESSCESNVVIVFIDGTYGSDIDCASYETDSAFLDEYAPGVGIIPVIVGGESDDFSCLNKLAEKRYAAWSGTNVFNPTDYDIDELIADIEPFIRSKVCTTFDTSAAYVAGGQIITESSVFNGPSSMVNILLTVIAVLLLLNLICVSISIYNKRNKKYPYEAVAVESEMSS